MTFPFHQNLDCPPYGTRSVLFDLLEEEDDEFEIPVLSQSEAEIAKNNVVENWATIWEEVHPRVSKLLSDYEYGKTLSELLAEPSNTIYVSISPPEDNEDKVRFYLDIAVDVGLRHGSHVFGVEFAELTPITATATF